MKGLFSGFRGLLFYEYSGLLLLFLVVGFNLFALLTKSSYDISKYVLMIFPLINYYAGRGLNIGEKSLIRGVHYVAVIYALVSLFALADLLFLDGSFWRDTIRQESYLLEVKKYTGGIIDGLIGNFYFDPFNLKIRRGIGTFGDPLAFAYSSILPICLLIFSRRTLWKSAWKYNFLLFLSVAGLLSSMTRAVMISLLFVLLTWSIFRRYFLAVVVIATIGILFVLAEAGFLIQAVLGFYDSSTLGHLTSLSLIRDIDPFQFLVGTMLDTEAANIFFESGFTNIIVNQGAFIGMWYYYFIYRGVDRMHRAESSLGFPFAMAGAAGMVTSIVFSESFFSFTGFGIFWFLMGAAVGVDCRPREHAEG